MKAKGCYSDAEIKQALSDVDMYTEWHLKRPGFFDMAINTGEENNREVGSLVLKNFRWIIISEICIA